MMQWRRSCDLFLPDPTLG